jgi:hypothetical protein
MQTVQLAIADAVYAAALREALGRSGPWHVVPVDRPDLTEACVLVTDEDAFNRLPLPLPNPERVVLITHKDPQHLSLAWDAGIVSVVSVDDAPNTVLLAIMSAALRIPKSRAAMAPGGAISPTRSMGSAHISPQDSLATPKRCKSH